MARSSNMKMVVAAGLAALATTLLFAPRAEAHAIGLSTGEYTAHGASVSVKLAFARGEVASLLPNLDADHDGHVSAIEVEEAKHDLQTSVLGHIHVTEGGAACTPILTGAALTESDGIAIDGTYDCPKAAAEIAIDVQVLDELSHGHRHVARSIGTATHDELLYKGHSSFTIAQAGAAAEAETATPAAAPPRSSFWSFFEMGIEHILTGYDHLVFLFGLVLLRAKLKELLACITAFTVAHSITLALAVTGILAPSPRFVEPAIALSIAYVGVENFFVKDGSKRWRITFPFGLIHGFGFAGALQQVNLPRAEVPLALLSFNLGVETGQLFALSLVLPMVMLIRQKDWFEPRGVQVLSGAVALAGGLWFVLRVAG